MITEERFEKLPYWIKRILIFLNKVKVPAKKIFILISVLATIWFLIRVIPKPSRATYPCMQVVAPLMSGFVIWLMAMAGTAFAIKKAKQRWIETRYIAAILFVLAGIGASFFLLPKSTAEAKTSNSALEIWYKPNMPVGVARGIFPGRVSWGYNPKIASWDGKTGFWWEDKFNNQAETDKLFSQTLASLTASKNDKKSWD